MLKFTLPPTGSLRLYRKILREPCVDLSKDNNKAWRDPRTFGSLAVHSTTALYSHVDEGQPFRYLKAFSLNFFDRVIVRSVKRKGICADCSE